MTAYPGRCWANCAPPYETPNTRPDVTQPGFELGSAVTPLAQRCSAFDRCDTREPYYVFRYGKYILDGTMILYTMTACFVT